MRDKNCMDSINSMDDMDDMDGIDGISEINGKKNDEKEGKGKERRVRGNGI